MDDCRRGTVRGFRNLVVELTIQEVNELSYAVPILALLLIVALVLIAIEHAPESMKSIIAILGAAIIASAIFGIGFSMSRKGVKVWR